MAELDVAGLIKSRRDTARLRRGKRHAPKGPIKVADPIDSPHPMKAQCVATNRQGKRCGKSPIIGGTVCRLHGGAAPQVMAKAKERLAALAPKAIQVLDGLLDRAQFPTVQFQASRFVIEQEVGKAVEHVDTTVDGDVTLRWQS